MNHDQDPAVRHTPVRTDTLEVTVSTTRTTDETGTYYLTAVFDDTDDRRHHGRVVAGWAVGEESWRSETPADADRVHEGAVGVLRSRQV